jgi:hypothetical protein
MSFSNAYLSCLFILLVDEFILMRCILCFPLVLVKDCNHASGLIMYILLFQPFYNPFFYDKYSRIFLLFLSVTIGVSLDSLPSPTHTHVRKVSPLYLSQ